MKVLVIIIVLVFGLIGCTTNTNERTVICKVKAELMLPLSYGDSTNVKELFYQRLKVLYPKAIEGAIARNEVEASPKDFNYEIEEPVYSTRIIQFYLSSYIDCNCRNIQDTLLYQLYSDFLERFPDKRTVENETKMSAIADELELLQSKLEEIKTPEEVVEQGYNLDSIKLWEEEWMKLMKQKEIIRIKNASYLYEFFTILNSGSDVQ